MADLTRPDLTRQAKVLQTTTRQPHEGFARRKFPDVGLVILRLPGTLGAAMQNHLRLGLLKCC